MCMCLEEESRDLQRRWAQFEASAAAQVFSVVGTEDTVAKYDHASLWNSSNVIMFSGSHREIINGSDQVVVRLLAKSERH